MSSWIELLQHSGRSAVDIALFTLLPIMLIVLCGMRMLEVWGVLDWVTRKLEPYLRWIGLTGLGLLAAIQMSFISFAAPLAVLTLMEQRGYAQRHLATTLAMVLAMAQANVLFPMASLGLDFAPTLLFSWLGGCTAAFVTHSVLARRLNASHIAHDLPAPRRPRHVLEALQMAGQDALRIATAALPMLAMALLLVAILQHLSVTHTLFNVLEPVLAPWGVDYHTLLKALTKYVGGGMALLGLEMDNLRAGISHISTLNQSAGWLIHATDLPGIAVLCAAGPRTAGVWRIAVLGACCGIAVRTLLHWAYF